MSGKETYIIEQKYTVDNSDLISGNKKAINSTDNLSGSVGGVTGKLKSLINPTNLVAGALAYASYRTVQAVKDFVAFERQLSSVNTLLKVSKAELNAYGDGLIDIAIKTGTAKESLADGAYQALSSGVDAKDLLEFMETTAKGAAVGMTDVSTATDVLTSTLNGFNIEGSQSNETMDKLITIQNNGKVVLGQLSTVMGDVADISSSLGVDLDNVGAAISTITMKGTPAAQAGTHLKAMFSELSKEGTTAYGVFEQITGKSFKEFISEGGNLGEALQEMQDYANSTGKEMVDLWSSIEAGQGAMGLTGSNASTFTKNLDAMNQSAGELEEAYSIASDNIATDWAKLTEKINSNWKELVSEFEEPIRTVIQVAYDVVDFTGNVNFLENTKKLYKLAAGNVIDPIADGLTRVVNDFQNENSMRGQETPNYFENELEEALSEKSSQREYLADLEVKAEAKAQAELLKQQKQAEKDKKEAEEQAIEDKKALLESIETFEGEHADKINQIDIDTLSAKKEYLENLNEQLGSGLISREEYEDKLTSFEDESELEQNERYVKALEELKEFYTSVGELTKANALEKQILEIEIETKITSGDNLEEDPALKEFLEGQKETKKEFNDQMTELEANFQYEMLTLKSQGDITDGEFAQKKIDHDSNMLIMKKEHDIEMLEEERDFYALEKNDMEKALEIETEIIEKKKELKSEELSNEEKYAKLKSNALDMAENVTTTAYSSMVNGTESFGEAMKTAMQDQLQAYLLSAGEEMAWKAIESTALGAYYLATGNTPMATEAFYSAAINASGAAAFGVAAKSLTESSSSSDDSDSDYNYDDDDDISTTEETASYSEDDDSPTIYVSTDENAMAKAMVNLLEKELNDEYNVSIIGNKK